MEENNTTVIEETNAEFVPTHIAEKPKFSFKVLWDKITTGLLVLFLASPFLVLLYILLWFINK